MGDRFEIPYIRCKECGELNEDVYYAPSSGVTSYTCSSCGKEIEIEIEISFN